MTVNPNSLDIAPSFKAWLSAVFHGKTHVTYGAFATAGIGSYLIVAFDSLLLRGLGIALVAIGLMSASDEAAHLFTN